MVKSITNDSHLLSSNGKMLQYSSSVFINGVSHSVHVFRLTCSYSFQLPDVVNILSGIHDLMESKLALFMRMSHLQGKLDVLLSQVRDVALHEERREIIL